MIGAFIDANNTDIIYSSETFLDSRIPRDDERIYITGYTTIRADHPSNTKRGDVCIYYKECFYLIRKIDIFKLNECIVTEITVNNERCFLTCLYRSLNQNQDQFESFRKNLIDVPSGINNQKPACSIIVDDFNAKLSKWCPSDKDNKAGQEIDTFTTTSGYTQTIDQPKHIINNKSSCTDLLFTANSKFLCDVGVEQTIYEKCHHSIIIYASLILNIPLPPPYYREVWD